MADLSTLRTARRATVRRGQRFDRMTFGAALAIGAIVGVSLLVFPSVIVVITSFTSG